MKGGRSARGGGGGEQHSHPSAISRKSYRESLGLCGHWLSWSCFFDCFSCVSHNDYNLQE